MLLDQLGSDPLVELRKWLSDAVKSGVKEPNAMALATATPDGVPSVRIVLAKGVESDAVHFFTNYDSRKGREMAENPRASAVFHWVEAARQARIEGRVERLSPEASAAYFASRPRGSQLAAWASRQSQGISGYSELMARLEAVKGRFGDEGPVPCPPNWGGFALVPHVVEFWLGMPSRLHDRVVFQRDGAHWTKRQLAP